MQVVQPQELQLQHPVLCVMLGLHQRLLLQHSVQQPVYPLLLQECRMRPWQGWRLGCPLRLPRLKEKEEERRRQEVQEREVKRKMRKRMVQLLPRGGKSLLLLVLVHLCFGMLSWTA